MSDGGLRGCLDGERHVQVAPEGADAGAGERGAGKTSCEGPAREILNLFSCERHGLFERCELGILAVNPGILSASGMDAGAVFTATALGAAIGTLLMAFLSNYPFALAPGMGLNAFFAFTVCGAMGYSWKVALAAVFVEGLIFIILSLTKVREALFDCIPMSLKFGVTGGIGLFIAFIGLQSAKIVVDGPCLVGLYNFRAALADGTFHSTGIGAFLALLGILITAAFLAKKVPGGILLGILVTWGLGMICEVTGLYVPNPKLGAFSVMPNFSNGISIPSLAPTLIEHFSSG